MPAPDLEALWEAHCRHEFETRDVDATMATMVARPYVNHIPTMTGGVGHDQLKRFYKYHFIGGNPPDTELRPVSRTIGANQLVDELIFSFTHTSEIDWLLPGIPPTGRRVEIPLVQDLGEVPEDELPRLRAVPEPLADVGRHGGPGLLQPAWRCGTTPRAAQKGVENRVISAYCAHGSEVTTITDLVQPLHSMLHGEFTDTHQEQPPPIAPQKRSAKAYR